MENDNFKQKNSPFGPDGDQPLSKDPNWKDFTFNDNITLNKLFNSFDWNKSVPELKKIRNTKIIGIIALVSLVISAFFPNKVVGGIAGIISFFAAIVWFVRKGYIFYYKKHKNKL